MDVRACSWFDRIVTGDKKWIHHWTPESKLQIMLWKGKNEAAPKNTKVVESAGKVMATVYWDSKGVFFIDYLPCEAPGSRLHAIVKWLKKLRWAIQNKRRSKLTKTVLLILDNARSHAATLLNTCLSSFNGMFLVTHLTPLILPQVTLPQWFVPAVKTTPQRTVLWKWGWSQERSWAEAKSVLKILEII